MSWDYGTLATEIYEIDKPIGHSFGDVEYYAALLAGQAGGSCAGRRNRAHPHPAAGSGP